MRDRTPEEKGGISAAAIRRPIGTLALMSVVVVLGFFFLDRLPVDLLPDIAYPQIRVTVNYPGTAPEVMEEQVTRVLERNLAATEGLIRIDSRASEGRTNVNLNFEVGTNLDLALQDASRLLELARTQLPPDIDPPRIYKQDPNDQPVYEAGFSSTVRSPVEVRDWLENQLATQLQSVAGVGGVEVAGGQVRELQVVVDQDRLSAYNLTVQDVIDAVAAQNRDIAAGNVTSESFDVMAKTDGRYRSAEDIGQVLVTIPGSRSRVRISDIAEVRDGHAEQRLFVRLNGDPAMRLSVFKLPESNTVQVVEGVAARIDDLAASGFIPADIQYQVTRDPAFFIRSSVRAVSTAALLGGVLAMLVVLLFLGSLRKSFVIGLSIPIAILATFAMMGVGNLTLNIMSLGGLALGVGLLLDNSIVMLENIFRHQDELGKDPDAAARDGSREVASAVVASTLTNLAAVVPFLLITGMAALIFRELILTISFAIVASLGVALTLVPMLAALLARLRFRSGLSESRLIRGFDRLLDRGAARYQGVIRRTLRARWAVVGGAVAVLAGSLWVAGDLGREFLPTVDNGLVNVRLNLVSGATPERTDQYFRQVEALVMDMPHVETVFTMAGGHLSGGVISERPGTARASVQLVPASRRPGVSANTWVRQAEEELNARLDIPGGQVSVSPPGIPGIQTSLAGADISIGVVGDDMAELDRLAREIVERAGGVEGLQNFELARDDRTPLLSVNVDRDRASALGLNVSDVGEGIRNALYGHVPTRFSTGTGQYDVRVMLPRQDLRTSEDLGGIRLFRGNGDAPVYVRDVASFSLGESPAHIERENQVRVVRISGEVNRAISDVGTVNQRVQAELAGFDLPQGYSLLYGGELEAIEETNRNLLIVILLSVFLVFVVMAVQYERLSNPLVILGAIPLALIGVVGMLWVTGTNLGAPVMLGVILLVGIVVNNSILLVEYIEIGRREQALGVQEAAVEAGRIRFRPILMTTLTTVLGMTPLALAIGDGAELMQPLALAVIGGLLVSMLLTLLVIPCLYVIMEDAKTLALRALTGREAGAAGRSSAGKPSPAGATPAGDASPRPEPRGLPA
ncbi:MAG: efflux RND transporter permease subunit [Gemmatimonadales bacterium]|nr:MAG: efflux RND transporter permease subunit [Gemmatimonadales bacterium]